MSRATRLLTAAACISLLLGDWPAAAQTDCRTDPNCIAPGTAEGEPLRQPFEIAGTIPTGLEVRYFTNVVVGTNSDGSDRLLNLRMYGHPEDGKLLFTIPGPTYRIRKGETFNLTLTNSIKGAPGGITHDCNPLSEPVNPPEVPPNCFHGNNITNFHFHGFHVSPKRISRDRVYDYIFLKLIPQGETCHADEDNCVEGTAYVTSGVIPENQAEGTHWFHPHHHGATALQVMNGMAGAFLVEGEFDEWLESFYNGALDEKVLVLQQILDEMPFPAGVSQADIMTLVNGQLNPVLQIGAGEIERWRLVNANAAASAHNTFTFPAGYRVKQIAMDGVQFAPDNYGDQPLLEGNIEEGFQITLAPGNRADFLVQGTGEEGDVLHESANPNMLRRDVRMRLLRGQVRPLFSVAPDAEYARKTAEVGAMRFPREDEWPKMPTFLDNIVDFKRDRCVVFSMDGVAGDTSNMIQFYINGKKFDPACIDQRMELDTAEQWTYLNLKSPDQNATIAHPAHIHVNPFQVWVRDGESHVDRYNPYPIWQDTIALPTDEDKITVTRSRFENFDGRFVLHCHILGHEDRGMMQQIEIGDESGLPLCREYRPDPRCEEFIEKRLKAAAESGSSDGEDQAARENKATEAGAGAGAGAEVAAEDE